MLVIPNLSIVVVTCCFNRHGTLGPDFGQRVAQVQPIVDSIRQNGDAAVAQWTSRFDKVDLGTVCCPIEV